MADLGDFVGVRDLVRDAMETGDNATDRGRVIVYTDITQDKSPAMTGK